MTAPRIYFSHDFYKKFIEKLQTLNRFVLDEIYLRTFIAQTDESQKNTANNDRIQSQYCSYIYQKLRQLPRCPSDELLDAFKINLCYCEEFINQDRASFLEDIDKLISQSYNLINIAKALVQVDSIVERYEELLSNVENLRRSVPKAYITPHLKSHYGRVLDSIRLHFPTAFSKMSEYDFSVSSESFKTKLNEAVGRKKETMREIPSQETRQLGLTLFRSDDSLGTKTRVGQQNIENKVQIVKNQMKSINELEDNIGEMEGQMEKMAEATDQARQQLQHAREQLSDVLEELVRLCRLLELLNKDISKQISEFQNQIDAYEKERQLITSDPSMTEDNKKKALEALNSKVLLLKEKQKKCMDELNGQKENLSKVIQSKIGDQMEELKRSKSGKSLSDCIKIDEQIEVLQQVVKTNVPLTNEKIGSLQQVFEAENAGNLTTDKKREYFSCENGEKFDVTANGQSKSREKKRDVRRLSLAGSSDTSTKNSEVSSTSAITHFEYAKQNLGRYLRLALAETVVHQPHDPINFIANHLLKQRHSQLSKSIYFIREENTRRARAIFHQLSETKNNEDEHILCNPCKRFD